MPDHVDHRMTVPKGDIESVVLEDCDLNYEESYHSSRPLLRCSWVTDGNLIARCGALAEAIGV